MFAASPRRLNEKECRTDSLPEVRGREKAGAAWESVPMSLTDWLAKENVLVNWMWAVCYGMSEKNNVLLYNLARECGLASRSFTASCSWKQMARSRRKSATKERSLAFATRPW
jgi:hypothetical protein